MQEFIVELERVKLKMQI